MTDTDPAEATTYYGDSEVIIRGIAREQVEAPNGTKFVRATAHVDFAESPAKDTIDIDLSQITIEGGLPALNDHLLARGLVPEWWTNNEPVPEELDE